MQVEELILSLKTPVLFVAILMIIILFFRKKMICKTFMSTMTFYFLFIFLLIVAVVIGTDLFLVSEANV